MKRFIQFLPDIWRETCGRAEMDESVGRAAQILSQHLPLKLLLVRSLDPSRPGVETVAAGALGAVPVPQQMRTDCSVQQMDRILEWCHQEKLLHQRAREAGQFLPGLLPLGLQGDILAGPLPTAQGPTGVLIAATRPPQSFQREHEQLFRPLLEPFAVALEHHRRLRELTALREAAEADNRSLLSRLGRDDIVDSIVGAQSGLRSVMQQVELVATSDVPVLILGETGTGKEVVARVIHTRSRHSAGPFLRVNCGAIPPELIDSELFGHERGSFTGAVNARAGWFERADGGTLFLDECGELPPAAQVRFLRILQDGSFERVGGEQTLHVNVRVVAATHRDLRAMVAEGRFREDLWYRIAVFSLQLPPLRDRREDIAALAAHFALRAAKRLGTPLLIPTPEDVELLVSYSWPGNVRELAAVIERAAILGDSKRLEVAQALGHVLPRLSSRLAHVPGVGRPAEAAADFLTLDAAMTRHIESALTQTRGRIEGPGGTAELLGINPHTLRARMRKLGVDWRHFRPSHQPRPHL